VSGADQHLIQQKKADEENATERRKRVVFYFYCYALSRG
jgi:hypothetical protein